MGSAIYVFFSTLVIFQSLVTIESTLHDTTPDEVEQLYQNFLTVLNSTYNSSISQVQYNKYLVDDTASEGLYRAEYYLFTELTVYNWNDFEDLIQEAKDKGTNDDKCQIYVQDFWVLVGVFFPNLTICIRETDKEAQNILNTSLSNITSLYIDVPNVQLEIDSCASTNQTCLVEITTEINQLNSTIPEKMSSTSEKSTEIADQYLVKVQNCTDNYRKRLRTVARTYMAEYAECTGLNQTTYNE